MLSYSKSERRYITSVVVYCQSMPVVWFFLWLYNHRENTFVVI